jgi:hypothetical protein
MSAHDEITNTNDAALEPAVAPEPAAAVAAPEESAAAPEPATADDSTAPAAASTAPDADEADEVDESAAMCAALLQRCAECRAQNDQYVSTYESSEKARAEKENDGMTVGDANFWMCNYAEMRNFECLARKPHFEENVLELQFLRDNGTIDAVFEILDPDNFHPALAPERNTRKAREVPFDRTRHLTSDFRDRETGVVKSRGEINTPLNSANGLTLFKAAALQGHGIVGFRMPRRRVDVPVFQKKGDKGKGKGKGKTERKYIFTDKPVYADHPKSKGKAKAKAKGKPKGRGGKGRDDGRDEYHHEDRTYLVRQDAGDEFQRRAKHGVSANDLDEINHLMRLAAPFHNWHVCRAGVGGMMGDLYARRGEIRTARREAKFAARSAKSGSRDNGKGGRKGKSASKSRGGDRPNGKGGRKNPNSRVSMSSGAGAGAGADAAAKRKVAKRKVAYYNGRPCKIATRKIKEVDADGFITDTLIKVRVFLDDEGGEMILGGKGAATPTPEPVADVEAEAEAAPAPAPEPEPTVEPAEPAKPAAGSWAAIASAPADPVKVAEAEARLRARAQAQAKARAEAEAESESDDSSGSSDDTTERGN